MDPIVTAIATGTISVGVIAASFVYGRTLLASARDRVEEYERISEDLIDARTIEMLGNIDRAYRIARANLAAQGIDFVTIAGERAILSDMVDELRQERDDLEGELAAHKVDAAEQAQIADVYAKQTQGLDDVIDHLTAQIGEAKLTVILPGHLADVHAEALIRVALRGRVSRGPASIGRAA